MVEVIWQELQAIMCWCLGRHSIFSFFSFFDKFLNPLTASLIVVESGVVLLFVTGTIIAAPAVCVEEMIITKDNKIQITVLILGLFKLLFKSELS